MGVIGEALAIGLFPRSHGGPLALYATGGAMIGVALILSIYEVIMIVFALIEQVNHQVRLVVVSIYSV